MRTPLRARRQPRRTLDEHLFLRFPWLAAAASRRIGKLPPGSRLRQAALRRSAQLALAAYNRRDADAAVVSCHPEFEYHPGRDWVDSGLVDRCYRGLEAYRRYLASVDEVWDGENYLTPVELIDLGERMVILAAGTMRAKASGVPLDQAFALVSVLEEGRPIHLQEYYEHEEALEAVGLPKRS